MHRALPEHLRADLDDSKRLVAHGKIALGEAWARALATREVRTPAELLRQLSIDGSDVLEALCPTHVRDQCWLPAEAHFEAPEATVTRLRGHLLTLGDRGVHLQLVRSAVICTRRLNDARSAGETRFTVDLHAMERLVLALRAHANAEVRATCGKVGSMRDYDRFFGPLAAYLHTQIAIGPAKSTYRFPGIGEVHFVRDADAVDPLVMLASLVGKYLRELLMTRIARHYGRDGVSKRSVSGYHDPVSNQFVRETSLLRQERGVPDTCFMRDRGG
jgi:hypothetical protein